MLWILQSSEVLADSELKTEEEDVKIKTVAALVCVIPTHHLMYENMCLDQIKLKIHLIGMAKKIKIKIKLTKIPWVGFEPQTLGAASSDENHYIMPLPWSKLY